VLVPRTARPHNPEMTLTRHLTFANVCSALALVVATSTGTAYAATKIRSTDIVNGQVKTADLAKNAATSAKIKNGQVKGADLGAGSVTTGKVKDGSLTAVDLLLGSLTGDQVADDSLGADDLAAGSVGGSEIQTDAVGATEIDDDSVDGGEIINNGLTFADIAGGGSTGNVTIPAGAVPNGRCENYSIGIAGASVGDAVVFSVQDDMQDGVFFYGARVSSANTVDTVLCNLSGAAQAAITNVQTHILTFR